MSRRDSYLKRYQKGLTPHFLGVAQKESFFCIYADDTNSMNNDKKRI